MTEIPANTPSPMGKTESFLPGISNAAAVSEACSTAVPLASVDVDVVSGAAVALPDSEAGSLVVVGAGADSVEVEELEVAVELDVGAAVLDEAVEVVEAEDEEAVGVAEVDDEETVVERTITGRVVLVEVVEADVLVAVVDPEEPVRVIVGSLALDEPEAVLEDEVEAVGVAVEDDEEVVPVAVVLDEVELELEDVLVDVGADDVELVVPVEVDEVPVAVEDVEVLVAVDPVDELDDVVDVEEEVLVAVPVPVDVAVELVEVVVPACPLGSIFVVHFETFSKTSSPAAFFFGVRVISQVSVRRPADVSVVVLVVTVVDPSADVVWRACSGRALTWAENRRIKERMAKNVDWVGRSSCIVNVCS